MSTIKDEEFRKLAKEKDRLQNDCEALNLKISILENSLKFKDYSYKKEILAREDNYQEILGGLYRTVINQEEEYGELREAFEELDNEKEQLQKDYDEVVLKNQELVSDLETAKSFENRDILTQLRVTQEGLQEMIEEKNRLWNQLQDAKDACQKKDDCINMLKDKLACANSSLEASEASKEQYKKDAEKWETLYSRLSKVNNETQMLVNSLQNDKLELKKDQEYLLNRAKKAEARVDELIKENNQLHDQVVFNTVDLDDCEELKADYIPDVYVECETLNLTINNWPELFEGDAEDEEE